MAYTLIWTPNSLGELERAVRYIAIDRPVAAVSFRNRVHELADLLTLQPKLGSIFENGNSHLLRELFCDPYRIIYRINDSRKTVHIVTLWHASRDEPTRADLLG